MKNLILILTITIFISCSNSKNTAYENKLNQTKKYYPFDKWEKSFSNGLIQYTPVNCNRAKKIFDDLITGLISAGENASEKTKIELFKNAILATNKLDEEYNHALIETEEREGLVELTDQITIACGLIPNKYGSNEGLASEWREW